MPEVIVSAKKKKKKENRQTDKQTTGRDNNITDLPAIGALDGHGLTGS